MPGIFFRALASTLALAIFVSMLLAMFLTPSLAVVFISGKKRKGLGARKLVYTQSVKISDHAYTTHHIVFPDRVVGRHRFNEYADFMVGLSSRVVTGFLKFPETSPCLSHDPMGIRTLALARRNKKSLAARWLNMRRPVRSFGEDSSLLEL